MKKYFKYLVGITLVLTLGVNVATNLYLLDYSTKQLQYKKRILELEQKKNNTSSMALETLYQDSINNTVNLWLYGTSK